MLVKVFVLGRPGSGKTTASHHIVELVEARGGSAIHVRDYEILYRMFQSDTNHEKFRPSAHSGFEVIDTSVLDTALKKLEQKARMKMYTLENGFLLVEFARDDYREAFKCFSANFLRDAYFFFIEADIESCIQRIHVRVTHSTKTHNHFVPDEIIRNYYNKDNKPYFTRILREEIGEHRITVVENTASLQDFTQQIDRFVDKLFEYHTGTITFDVFPTHLIQGSDSSLLYIALQ